MAEPTPANLLVIIELQMPEVGFEPTRPLGQSILNRPRLPFRHSGRPAKGSRAQDRVKTATIVPTGQNDGERTGNHLREGIFMMAGAGARRGAALPMLDMCDVAPTLLYVLDLPVQEDMDGAVAAAALAPGYLEAHPVRTDQLAPPPEVAAADMSDHDRRAIEGMLEGLGYL